MPIDTSASFKALQALPANQRNTDLEQICQDFARGRIPPHNNILVLNRDLSGKGSYLASCIFNERLRLNYPTLLLNYTTYLAVTADLDRNLDPLIPEFEERLAHAAHLSMDAASAPFLILENVWHIADLHAQTELGRLIKDKHMASTPLVITTSLSERTFLNHLTEATAEQLQQIAIWHNLAALPAIPRPQRR